MGSNELPTCSIKGCDRRAEHTYQNSDRAYCSDCLNRMQHYALDMAGVP